MLDQRRRRLADVVQMLYSGDPVSGRLTKRTIPKYGLPLASPKCVPIHIMYYQIQKAKPTRDSGHGPTFFYPTS